VNNYTPDELSGYEDAMMVERKYTDKIWETEQDQAARSVSKTNWFNWISDGTNYEYMLLGMVRIHHEIIKTDYDNYAIAYGCDNWFGGIFHTRWSALLSRQPFLSH